MTLPPPSSRPSNESMERQLLYQNILLQAIWATAPDGILVVDQGRRIQSWNQRFLDIWGLGEEVMQGGKAMQARDLMVPLLADPEAFAQRVDYLYDHLDEVEESYEVPMADGRVLIRYSRGLVDQAGRHWGRVWFYRDITHRVRIERELRRHHGHLEDLVATRTAKLAEESGRRRMTENQLLRKEEDLKAQARRLAETNIALRVFLKQSAEDAHTMTTGLRSNLEAAVLPYLESLAASSLNPEQRMLLDIIRGNLEELAEPFARKLSDACPGLTPREVQVAGLVRGGRTNKEIATALGISARSVEFHRENLRKKLGLTGRRANLRSRLLALA